MAMYPNQFTIRLKWSRFWRKMDNRLNLSDPKNKAKHHRILHTIQKLDNELKKLAFEYGRR